VAIADGRSVSGRILPGTEDLAPIWQHAHYPWGVRLLNRVGRVVGGCGIDWPRLDPESLMAAARRRTGLADFGDGLFREGLDRLVESFQANPAVHGFGRHFFREYCVGVLANRLRITDELKRHPEIHDVPVARPLVITGLPRSGTTLLHRLMSEDPAGRIMLFWEAFEPSPAPRPETYRTDPRIGRARKALALINGLAPRIPAAHHFAAEEPEEDNTLFAHEFRAGFIGFMFDVPDYTRWLNAQDRVPGYRSMRRQLQLLSRHIRGDYWILKSPAHVYGLDALLTVFPDANVVHTHRDPGKVIPSLASLSAGFRSLVADPLDLRRLGTEFAEAMAEGLEQAMTARASADPARFFDVRYESLVADPVDTVREVCQSFGYDFTPEYEARTRHYLAENPQHKHGVHRYSLDDFGLDAAAVARHFGDYRAWVEEHVPQMV
jgi:hypothetical protein